MNINRSLAPPPWLSTPSFFKCFHTSLPTPQGRLEEAISDYSAAIRLKPNHSRAFYNRGFCYDGLGRHEEALKDYSLSIQLEPVNVTAYHNRGSLYQRLGR